jgi:methionine-rich copper-binding protein CopC
LLFPRRAGGGATRVAAHAVCQGFRPHHPVRQCRDLSHVTFNTSIGPGSEVVLRSDSPESSAERERRHAAERRGGGPAALPAGAYALQYKVLAADGHVSEGSERFQVSSGE